MAFCPAEARSISILDYRQGDGTFRFPNRDFWIDRLMRRTRSAGPLAFAGPTVRMLAQSAGFQVVALTNGGWLPGKAFAGLHGRHIVAQLQPGYRSSEKDPRLSLGIIASPAASQDVILLCRDMAPHVSEAIIAVDADNGVAGRLARELAEAVPNLPATILEHRLNGDFAAQRNRVQAACRTPWVLHLDTDERLDADSRAGLCRIVDEADGQGWSGVALPRRNLVNGILSSLYPDVQTRLIRRDIRFVRAVHEYPEFSRWQKAPLSLAAAITHHLDSERFERREKTYEAIEAGAGRPHDTALLLMPYPRLSRQPADPCEPPSSANRQCSRC